jgi:hypothetical protein
MRRSAARTALVFLALSALVALGGASAAPPRPTVDTSDTITRTERHHALVAATAPVAGTDWATHQPREPSGPDRSIAVLLAVAALVVGRRWQRFDAARDRVLVALRGRGSGIRGPPAFA